MINPLDELLNPWWTEEIQMRSSLSPDSVLKELANREVPRLRMRAPDGLPGLRPMFFRTETLTYERPRLYQNGWRPLAEIHLQPEGGHTLVTVKLRRSWGARIFALIWWPLVALVLVGSIPSWLAAPRDPATLINLPIYIAFLLFIALAIPVLGLLLAKGDVKYLKSVITDAVGGKPVTL